MRSAPQTPRRFVRLLLGGAALAVAAWQGGDPLLERQWHLKGRDEEPAGASVRAAWPASRGSGVVMGIVDDGVEADHPDLRDGYDPPLSYDFIEQDPDPGTPTARHGTAVAGIAAATADNNRGISGVAPGARFAVLRMLGAPVTDADVAAALAHGAETIQILNNSWGPSDSGTTLGGPGPLTLSAIESAARSGRDGRGRIFVWASGNGRSQKDNCNYDGYANNRFVMAVGAVADTGRVAWYSEPCSALFVSAPSSGGGREITTTDVSGPFGYATGDYTHTFGGTSAAAPIVSGTVGLVLAANPALTSRDVQHILVQSAVRIDPAHPGWTSGAFPHNEHYGFGLVDAAAAVDLARAWVPVPPETATDRIDHRVDLAIPDGSPEGIQDGIAFDSTFATFSVERVEVDVAIAHERRGNLDVQLVSPSGVVSRLGPARRADGAADLEWRFTSVRHWGEEAAGTWMLRVADVAAGNTGTWHRWSLRLHGTQTCRYELQPGASAFPIAGGNGAATLRATAGCPWTARATAPWITVTSQPAGVGDAAIAYAVAPNPTSATRSGQIVAGRQAHVVIQAGHPPNRVSVLAPRGGQKLFSGASFTIAWSAAVATPVASFDVRFATDGRTWSPVPGCTALPPRSRSCRWTRPAPESSRGVVMVAARDVHGNEATDTSDPFRIVSGAPSVVVTWPGSPRASWAIGTPRRIAWTHNLGLGSTVRVEVQRDGGPWRVLAREHPNSAAGTGSFRWTVPGPASASARFRVTWTDGPASDASDVPIEIAPPFLRLTRASSGAHVGIGTRREIRWAHNLGAGARVALDLSADDGRTWRPIAQTGSASPSEGAYTWTVPSAPAARARLRARWPESSSVRDVSAPFEIAAPFIRVITPSGPAHAWREGHRETVRWAGNLGPFESVRIELSTDGGASYQTVLWPASRADAQRSVRVAGAWATPFARVRVVWLGGLGASGVSPHAFVVEPARSP